DLPRASTELETATRVEPGSSLAQREVGLLLLQTNHADRAIEYLRTAVQTDPSDRVAMGWLGCALIRVGNTTVAQSFFTRAGQGDWTACRTDPTAATAGTLGGNAPLTGAPAPSSATPSSAAPAGRP
ncbi:MAG TPA: hypothetical protein VGD56_16130, partial [Gemmatirosa sp.]